MSSTEELSWRELESRFRGLQTKDLPPLAAEWSGILREWTFIESNPSTTRRFKSIAKLAARKADLRPGVDEFLNLLREQERTFEATTIQSSKSGLGPHVTAENGIIRGACEAAADYCEQRADRELEDQEAGAPYELMPDFRLAKKEIHTELRALFEQRQEIINRDCPEGDFRNTKIEDACCGHLYNTAKRYSEELLEQAPLTPSRRSVLLRRAIDAAFDEVRAYARSCGGYSEVEKYRDFVITLPTSAFTPSVTTATHSAMAQPVPLAVPPSASPSPPARKPATTISNQLDEATLHEDISHEEQAARIGISRATYFEVKAGRGGRKSRRKVERYLSKVLSTKST